MINLTSSFVLSSLVSTLFGTKSYCCKISTVRDSTATSTFTQLLSSVLHCCFTSTETVRIVRNGERRTASSTFTSSGITTFSFFNACFAALKKIKGGLPPKNSHMFCNGHIKLAFFFLTGYGLGSQHCFAHGSRESDNYSGNLLHLQCKQRLACLCSESELEGWNQICRAVPLYFAVGEIYLCPYY